jgi:hypothetical protein
LVGSLNTISGGSGHPCLVPHFTGIVSSVFLLTDVNFGVWKEVFYYVRKYSSISTFIECPNSSKKIEEDTFPASFIMLTLQ